MAREWNPDSWKAHQARHLPAYEDAAAYFSWPEAQSKRPPTVGDALVDLMQADGWHGAEQWRQQANEIAPTLVGGSKKHGGPDLGPTRAKKAWAALGVDPDDHELWQAAFDRPGSGFNFTSYQNPQLEALLVQGLTIHEPRARAAADGRRAPQAHAGLSRRITW